MPTYDDLRDYFDRSEEFQRVTRQAAEVPIVSGFTIDVDPLWTFLYDAEEGSYGADFPVEPWLDHVYRSPFLWHRLSSADWPQPSFQGYRRRDLHRPVRLWSEVNGWYGRKRCASPVILTIVHRPVRTPVAETTSDDEAHRRRLIEIANASGALVRVEERPEATLAFAPGDGILTSQGRSGTYGGTLTGRNGTVYGMTCAHVAETNDAVSDSAGTALGTCRHHTNLVTLAAGTVCDPVGLPMPNPYPGNGPSVNMLDLSLIELAAPPATARTLGGVAASLTIGQDVVFEGAHNRVGCRLGSLAISYGFRRSGSSYCFRDTIELKPKPRFGLGGALGTIFSSLPAQGDSGAWVLTSDTPPVWAGVFFGEDGHRGYCIRASWAHAWATSLVGTLSV
ncbi:hypothetical protein [Enterovirga aerilata]|uniref:Trypsin-like peptidase domain-containing protein n=1 Tax=Enterovirga aerilata TaxID=2730920 RepID=A0A849HY85_9HYPH|nr:hypothetical protein [Enterovirga sp. DB1703]NNM72072.1 hypothetical protein [Enterovirga sp. DB1703]